ncbi:hypothetical protein COT99_02875 [Candidatus Falkowbacteria bacterium CG10_big_fil_rev_8_21_14_0_10_43_10]|uniref:Glycosyl transferase family 1 domain-containing protein n=1 Tax=Candidatus Falkowbacteria bacterium CG10_big_fil_rev_8_21_14_0_10_43_10 TaxID=1974567 RepID=A0A2H0V1S9_9BACT|nr:MAG: hypothetical protein COT99_02875 [Candidatus Falkowbacteria bacterium CG10_big_fil_rev_8_21_14_0_10_43_10]
MINEPIFKQKKTLLFTLEYPPFKGGVANYYGNVVKYWDDESIKVLTGKKLLKPHWIFSLWRLWQAVKKHRIQTVLVGHILPLGTVTWLLRKIIKFDYVVFLHGMDLTFAMKSRRKKWLARRILADAKKIICANSYAAKIAGEIVNSGKVAVVNPGIEVRSMKSEVRSDELKKKYNLQGKKILLQVGRLVKRKGYDKVIETLPEVLKQVPNLVYIIIGDGPELDNIKYSILNIKDNVLILTDVNDEELEAWYDLCDIFIMPSRDMDGDFEGFGIVYLEANAHGKPVIAGDSGGVRDAVKDGVNGLLVNPENTEEIADAIIKLYKDDELRIKLGEQGREWVKEFSWENKVKEIKQKLSGN